MKIHILLATLFLLPLFSSAQQSKTQQFYYKHAGVEGAKHVSIQCDLTHKAESGEDKILPYILYAKLLILDTEKMDAHGIDKLLEDAGNEQFQTLVDVRSKGEELHLKVKELPDDKLSFLAVALDDANFIYANIAGKFAVKDLMSLELNNVKNADELIEKLKKLDQCDPMD